MTGAALVGVAGGGGSCGVAPPLLGAGGDATGCDTGVCPELPVADFEPPPPPRHAVSISAAQPAQDHRKIAAKNRVTFVDLDVLVSPFMSCSWRTVLRAGANRRISSVVCELFRRRRGPTAAVRASVVPAPPVGIAAATPSRRSGGDARSWQSRCHDAPTSTVRASTLRILDLGHTDTHAAIITNRRES